MTIEQLLQILNQWIGWIGGSAGIVAAVITLFQKRHIARFENELSKTRDILNKVLEGEVYAKNKIFDKEFSVYEELWNLITDLEAETHKLLCKIENKQFEVYGDTNIPEEKLNFVQYYNETNNKLRKISPYMPENIYKEINERFGIFKWCVQSSEVHGTNSEFVNKVDQNIQAIREMIAGNIRSHIKNIEKT